MDTYLAIASRRDERRYRSEALPEETTAHILDAGRLAGSARNRQPWTFVVVSSVAAREALSRAVYVPDNVSHAGLVVAVVVEGGGPTRFDAGRAAQNMLLAAWNRGVSSCPNGIADPDAASAALGLRPDEESAIVLSFGVPEHPRDPEARSAAEWSARANRKPLADVVRHL